MAKVRVWNEEAGAHLLTEITTPAEELEQAYARFQALKDDAKAEAWNEFADLCETHLPTILAALRYS
jgi:hypothetical protein